jgi:NtrC-family two-component system sensor histidine kinase KinB
VVGQPAAPDAVTVIVTDTGPGVHPAFPSRSFDKFFRLEHHHQTDVQRHPRGAGIDLYLCRQIVELHRGRIECATGPDDHGARISVFLPVRTENAVATTSIDSFTATVG